MILSKDFNFLETLLRDFKTSNPITTMALICFMAPPCKGLILDHMDEFMEKYEFDIFCREKIAEISR